MTERLSECGGKLSKVYRSKTGERFVKTLPMWNGDFGVGMSVSRTEHTDRQIWLLDFWSQTSFLEAWQSDPQGR